MKYINMKSQYSVGVETIDEFETLSDARKALKEYQLLGDPHTRYYISSRSTREWLDR